MSSSLLQLSDSGEFVAQQEATPPELLSRNPNRRHYFGGNRQHFWTAAAWNERVVRVVNQLGSIQPTGNHGGVWAFSDVGYEETLVPDADIGLGVGVLIHGETVTVRAGVGRVRPRAIVSIKGPGVHAEDLQPIASGQSVMVGAQASLQKGKAYKIFQGVAIQIFIDSFFRPDHWFSYAEIIASVPIIRSFVAQPPTAAVGGDEEDAEVLVDEPVKPGDFRGSE